ncbi:MAG TPA: SURF1 family cytochrome oxidase biogenesis protein [Pseudonocardia sp.]
MRFLFKPGWIAFVLVVIAFAVSCYTLLAPWQFRRNAQQAAQNDAVAASFAHPPQPLGTLVPAGAPPPAGVEWRLATVRGRYLPADEAVVRLRTVLGNPAFEVLTAFRTDEGRTMAVDRGYVRPGDGRQVTPFPAAPGAVVTLTGRIRLDENDPDHRPTFVADGHRQLYAADSRALGQVVGQPLDAGYLQLVDGQTGGLGVLPLPDTDSGPFLSYAWQWLSFGAIALFGLGYFIRLELLQRRAGAEGEPAAAPAPARGNLRAALRGEQPADARDPRSGEVADAGRASSAAEDSGRPEDSGRAADSGRAEGSRDTEAAGRAEGSRGADNPDGAEPAAGSPPAEQPAAPDRDRLAERYGKARF